MSSEIDRIRYERLKLVCKKALEQSIKKSLSMDQIKTCYPTIASTEEGQKSLEIARSQIIKFWHNNSTKEFDLIFKERNIETKLDELDEIIQKAEERKIEGKEAPVQVDRVSPSELIEASLAGTKKESIESLSMIYNQLCLDNMELYGQLNSLCEESETIRTDLKSQVDSLSEDLKSLRNDDFKVSVDDLIATMTE
ncbi:uncharacterized protein AC631_03308 [Debaryomyces fabryi]|uniref:Kinetochore-associated protein n=1 Tax=Debaryomyces fabryi TaxID=58627 RepID=A0A0V1PXW1_9ASCO|nr:uncharacterized protein AC631_03308 [Debaryomyces fabryi]KSA00938.1 hypothetical protein AC631_03308 [Debaryomyces fabryi]